MWSWLYRQSRTFCTLQSLRIFHFLCRTIKRRLSNIASNMIIRAFFLPSSRKREEFVVLVSQCLRRWWRWWWWWSGITIRLANIRRIYSGYGNLNLKVLHLKRFIPFFFDFIDEHDDAQTWFGISSMTAWHFCYCTCSREIIERKFHYMFQINLMSISKYNMWYYNMRKKIWRNALIVQNDSINFT